MSRAELACFLGVSDATVVRWEDDDATSEPKGLQAVVLDALGDAVDEHGPELVASLVRCGEREHRAALLRVLEMAG